MFTAAGQTKFLFRYFKELFIPPFEWNETFNQSFAVIFKSFIPSGITAFVMGIVIVLQSRPSLVEFGAGAYIPSMAAATIIREVGPLITALICAGNIGSGISAELGSMKITEQIDAMEVSGANPFKFLVVTRVTACTLMIPILVIYADGISLLGAYTGANIKGESSIYLFFDQIIEKLKFNDVFPALIKSVLFGFTIGMVSCYQGFNSQNGTVGVGKATNAAVLSSLLFIIIIDMVVVQIANIFNIL
ncbi:MAG: ABC transporter permease [Bacteroidetes bacterium]|nr:ABC transporter permease [Bacteroidota bacterium]